MKDKRITVSFPKTHEAEWRHILKLKKTQNISVYICSLIRADLRKETGLEETIARIIDSKLKGTQYNNQPDRNTSVTVKAAVTDDELKRAVDSFDF